MTGLDFGLPPADEGRPSAAFPDLTFLQLLFGYRSLDELFPKAPSKVWPIL